MADQGDPADEFTEDEACASCGYDLRGLTAESRCPECGEPIPPMWPPEVDQDPIEPFRQIAEQIRINLEAVLFVWQAVGFAIQRAQRSGRPGEDFTAEEFRWCFRDYTLEQCEDDPDAARQRLTRMGLRHSDDVGAIVLALVEAKMLQGQAMGRQSDFNGLFTLDTLFDDKAG